MRVTHGTDLPPPRCAGPREKGSAGHVVEQSRARESPLRAPRSRRRPAPPALPPVVPLHGSTVPLRGARSRGAHPGPAAVPTGERFAPRVPQRSRPAYGPDRPYRSGPDRRTARTACTAAVRGTTRSADRESRSGTDRRTARTASPAAVPTGVRYAPRVPQRYRPANGSHRLHRSSTDRRTVRTACTAAGRVHCNGPTPRRAVSIAPTAAVPPGERFAPPAPQRSRPANGSHRLHRSGADRRTVRTACTAAVRPGRRYAPSVPQRDSLSVVAAGRASPLTSPAPPARCPPAPPPTPAARPARQPPSAPPPPR